MVKKNCFDKALAQLIDIANRYDLEPLRESVQRIVSVRDAFEMKVLFIGHFSAGKSALINELIGKGEYLEEGQNPTTAQIRELRTSDPDMDGLAELADYVIVDTPGFNSSVASHDKALATYLGEGGAYVLVVDVTRGDLDPVTLRYLDEVVGYTGNVAIVLNRCDQTGEASREDVLSAVTETLNDRGYRFPVVCLSRHDADVKERLTALIKAFDGQAVFQQRMQAAFQAERGSILAALKLALRHADGSTWEVDQQLDALRALRSRVQRAFALERESAENDLPQRVDAVMVDVQTALEGRADVCAELVLAQDAQALEAVMLTAVRPVLLRHVRDVADSQVNALLHELDFTNALGMPVQKELATCVSDTLAAVKELINSGTLGQALDVLNREGRAARAAAEAANKTYKAVTGITAILTDVIAPWAEVVIVLLPEIVGLCKALFGATEHDVARDRYLKRIVTVVVARLYPTVETAIHDAVDALSRNLEAQCSRRIAALDAEVRELESRRQRCIDDGSARHLALEQDVKFVSNLQQLEVRV